MESKLDKLGKNARKRLARVSFAIGDNLAMSADCQFSQRSDIAKNLKAYGGMSKIPYSLRANVTQDGITRQIVFASLTSFKEYRARFHASNRGTESRLVLIGRDELTTVDDKKGQSTRTRANNAGIGLKEQVKVIPKGGANIKGTIVNRLVGAKAFQIGQGVKGLKKGDDDLD